MKRKKSNKKKDPDTRYKLIGALIRDGQIHSFNQIFDYIPITIVASDLHIKAHTLNNFLEDGVRIKVKHVLAIGMLCELTEPDLIRLLVSFRRRVKAEKKAKMEKTNALIERINCASNNPTISEAFGDTITH